MNDADKSREQLIAELNTLRNQVTSLETSAAQYHQDEAIQNIAAHKQTQEALHESEGIAQEFQDKLTALLELNLELSKAPDLDTLYRRAIELGRARLGFDRIGLFLFDDTLQKMVGTYGIDPQGQLLDLHDAIFDVYSERPEVVRLLRNEQRFLLWEDVPLLEGRDIVGRGWNAAASLSYGDTPIGWLAADNLLGQAPIKPYERELLTLYGATIGHLIIRKRTEESLRETEARLRQVLENMPVMLDAFDAEGRIIHWNRECERVSGYSAQEIEGNPQAMSMLYPDPDYRARIQEMRQERGLDYRDWEMNVTTRAGEIRTVSWSNISGQFPVSGWASWSIGIDVTERKQAEQRKLDLALEQGRVQVLADFITKASHEFRTPLSIINTNAYLSRRMSESEDQLQLLRKIEDQTRYIDTLINRMTTMTQLDSGNHILNFENADLNTLVNMIGEAAGPMIEEQALQLVTTLGAENLPVWGDPIYLRQAIEHILHNAIHHTPPGGVITLHSRRTDQQAVLEIIDTGEGIPKTIFPHIFERFYRIDQAGTTRGFGLGLPIAQAVIERHRGSIEVQSAPGKGSTFRIRLPITPVR